MVFLSSPSAVRTSVVSLSLRFSGRMTSSSIQYIAVSDQQNLALSAKHSFAIESFALNPSPPVLLCEQENLVPMRVQWYSLRKVYMCCPSLCFLYVYIMIITLYTVHLSSDYIIWLSNCPLAALSVFCLHTAFQFSCC